MPVYFGGPVQTDRGFVLHRPAGEWQSTLKVSDDIGLTSSRDVLQSMGSAAKPQEVLVTLGYAGWSAGQLEQEMARHDWLTHPATADLVFKSDPAQLWKEILRQKDHTLRWLADSPENLSWN
jgi:putative transcriptional regulator